MKITTPIAAMLVALAAPVAGAETLYKCLQDGKTVYQAEPCPENAKQDKLKAQVAPAPAAAGGRDVAGTIEFMSTYRACADGVRIWGEEMAGPYANWRKRNLAMVTRVEKDGQLQNQYRQKVEAKRNGKVSMCRDVALELRGKKP